MQKRIYPYLIILSETLQRSLTTYAQNSHNDHQQGTSTSSYPHLVKTPHIHEPTFPPLQSPPVRRHNGTRGRPTPSIPYLRKERSIKATTLPRSRCAEKCTTMGLDCKSSARSRCAEKCTTTVLSSMSPRVSARRWLTGHTQF